MSSLPPVSSLNMLNVSAHVADSEGNNFVIKVEHDDGSSVASSWNLKKTFDNFESFHSQVYSLLSKYNNFSDLSSKLPALPTKRKKNVATPVIDNYLASILGEPLIATPCTELLYKFLEIEQNLTNAASTTTSTGSSEQATVQLTGWLKKEGGSIKTWKKRFCVLQGSNLLYYKDEKTNTKDAQLQGYIPLTNKIITKQLTPEEHKTKPKYSFKVVGSVRTYFMHPLEECPDAEQQVDTWIKAMKKVSNNYLMCSYLLSPMRLRKNTWFTKQGAVVQNWKKRYFVLEDDTLHYYKSKNVEKVCGSVLLTGSLVRKLTNEVSTELLGKSNVIQVETAKRTYNFISESLEQMDLWYPILVQASLLYKKPSNVISLTAGTSISSAISKATDGDIIELEEGEYQDNLVITKPVLLRAKNQNKKPVIVQKDTDRPIVSVTTSRTCAFQNIQLKGPSTGQGEDNIQKEVSVVEVNNAGAFFKSCHISGGTGNGIKGTNQAIVLLNDCDVCFNAGCGLSITNNKLNKLSSHVIVEHSRVYSNTSDGIQVLGNASFIIQNCSVYKNKYNGIASSASDMTIIKNCEVYDNEWDGICVNFVAKDLQVFDNKSFSNKGYGVFVLDSKPELLIVDNVSYKNEKEGGKK